MNPADQAQVEQAKWNASEARRAAGSLMGSAQESAQLFTTQAQQLLATGMTTLGKSGNLSTETSALPNSGIGVGTTDSKEYFAEIARLQKIIEDKGFDPAKQESYDTQAAKVKSAQDSLSALESSSANVADIQNPDALLHASGSDLLTMVTTRDALERDKRTMMRNAQAEAAAMIRTGAQWDVNADYSRQAAEYNMWTNILNLGLKVASFIPGVPKSRTILSVREGHTEH